MIRLARPKGIAMPVALMAGILFVLAVGNLTLISNQELRVIRKISYLKRAEMEAYSGIQIVQDRLHKNRWYQPTGDQFSNPDPRVVWKNFHRETIATDDGEGEVEVFVDEFPSKARLTVHQGNKTYDPCTLSHIKVLCLGKAGKEKTLYYGKFVVSPEPMMNSNSTDGVNKEPKVEEWTQLVNYEEDFPIRIQKIHARQGDQVSPSQRIVDFMSDSAAHLIPLDNLSPRQGIIKQIFVTEGQVVRKGQRVATVVLDTLPEPMNATVKRMVRIFRVPLELHSGLDLGLFADRNKIYQSIKGLSELYVSNYSAVAAAKEPIAKAFEQDDGVRKIDSTKDVFQRLKIGNIHWNNQLSLADKKTVLLSMLKEYCPPEITSTEEREKFRKAARYSLDPTKKWNELKPQPLNPDVENIVKGLEHGRNYLDKVPLAQVLQGKGLNAYQIAGTEEYTSLMDQYYGRNPLVPKLSETQNFIQQFSRLPDARLEVSVDVPKGGMLTDFQISSLGKPNNTAAEEMRESYREEGIPENHVKKIEADPYRFYFLVHIMNSYVDPQMRKKHFYKKNDVAAMTISVVAELKPQFYHYSNSLPLQDGSGGAANLSFRMDYLLEFFSKYFEEEGFDNPSDGDFRLKDVPMNRPVIAPTALEKWCDSGYSM
jgi:hypothetical protein